MNGVRKHYMTICFRNNTEVTHILRNGVIYVTFEQAVNKGFLSCVFSIDGMLQSNSGFNASDIDFFKRFLAQNREGILMESRGEL